LLVATLSDVHRRKEDELNEFRSRVESLVNNSPNMMSLKGLDGRFLLANRAYSRMLGVTEYAMVGRLVAIILPGGCPAHPAAGRSGAQLPGAAPVRRKLQRRHATFTMLVTKFPLFDSQGRPAGVGSVDTDITRTREEQKAKKEAEEKYWALVEQTLVGIYILQDERLVYVNPKLADIVGYRPEDMQDMPLESLLPPSEASRIRLQIKRRLRDNIQVMHYTTRAISRDGHLVDWKSTAGWWSTTASRR
jgi:PAS domain S-box-containing protein